MPTASPAKKKSLNFVSACMQSTSLCHMCMHTSKLYRYNLLKKNRIERKFWSFSFIAILKKINKKGNFFSWAWAKVCREGYNRPVLFINERKWYPCKQATFYNYKLYNSLQNSILLRNGILEFLPCMHAGSSSLHAVHLSCIILHAISNVACNVFFKQCHSAMPIY